MELVRQKNVASVITFPIIDADGDTVTGATGLDSESTTWADGSTPGAFADLTNEATEIGTTGIYYLSLTAAELNFDYIYIQIKTSSSGAKTQHILINTMVGDPLNRATTTSGRELDVSAGGEAGLDWANIGSPTTAQNLSATNIDVDQIVASVSGAVGSVTGAVGSVTGLTPATVHSDLDDIQARLPAALVSGRIDASVGAMAAAVVTAAAIATDAIDADALAADAVTEIWAKALTEPTAVVAASPTALAALSWLLTLSRNKITQTATTQLLRNDADAATIATATVSDDAVTAIRSEWV